MPDDQPGAFYESINDETVADPSRKYGFELVNTEKDDWWAELRSYRDSTIFQTRGWMSFISITQQAELVLAVIKEGGRLVGYFTGLITSRYGVRILGSPFPGWSTDYMGFALLPGTSRKLALQGLLAFAFDHLKVAHVELMDRHVTAQDLIGLQTQCQLYRTFVIDLTQSETALFSNMTSACRRCIRKAEKNGLVIEIAPAGGFAEEYFDQLKDVFAKQRLVPTYGVDRVKQLIAHLHPTGHLLLLRARDQDGRCIATGIFPHANGVMHFWGGASWRRLQILRPNEALHWYAMKYAKGLGFHTYDMGGGGEYKRKYGGQQVEVPWIRKSKYAWVASARSIIKRAYIVRQRWLGRLRELSQPRRKTDAT